MSDKTDRQGLIKKIIEDKNVKTQEELVMKLHENGFKVTQATVSRDVNELGLVRDEFGYKSAEEKALEEAFRWVKDIKITGSNLIVVLTEPGTAQTVALAIDKAEIKGVIGSIAGDDTVFLAIEEDRSQNIIGLLMNLG